jgi:tetratricopeptide (TPR) repeat protein
MEQNEEDKKPAAQNPAPTGCPCGCGVRKGSNKFVIAIWVVLLLGGVSLFLHFQSKRKAEAERLLNEAYMLYGQRDFSASTEYLRQSAELGNAWAQLYYGERLKTGFGAEPNMPEAVKWLRRAAKQKCVEAYYQLGVCYENGEGVERNLDEAEAWYKKALDDPGFAPSARDSLERIAQRKAASGAGMN